MTFKLRKEHLAVHTKITKSKSYKDIARQLEFEFQEQFITQVKNDSLGWTEKAIAKAKKYGFDQDEEILYEFCRVLVFIGLSFDKNKEYPEIVGILKDNPDYVPYPLTKLEQIDDQLNFQTRSTPNNDGKNK